MPLKVGPRGLFQAPLAQPCRSTIKTTASRYSLIFVFMMTFVCSFCCERSTPLSVLKIGFELRPSQRRCRPRSLIRAPDHHSLTFLLPALVASGCTLTTFVECWLRSCLTRRHSNALRAAQIAQPLYGNSLSLSCPLAGLQERFSCHPAEGVWNRSTQGCGAFCSSIQSTPHSGSRGRCFRSRRALHVVGAAGRSPESRP